MSTLKFGTLFKFILVTSSLYILFSCNQAGSKETPPNDSTNDSGKAVAPITGLPALNYLTIDGDTFFDLPTGNSGNSSSLRTLVFRYFTNGSGLTMRGWLYKKNGNAPAGGINSSFDIEMKVGLPSGLSLNDMYLSCLNLSNQNIDNVKSSLGPAKPTNKTILFIPVSKAQIDANPGAYPHGINTDDNFAWVTYIIDKTLFEGSDKSMTEIMKLASTAAMSTSTFNPSPPKELSP